MNRRSTIKGLIGISLVGISSFSVFKWINLNHKADLNLINSYRALLAELADTIIPTTDSPGAKEANVQDFIINVIVNCTGNLEQNKFLNGLKDLEEYTYNKYGRSFDKCELSQRNSVLKYFENRDSYSYPILNKINNKLLGQPFFTKLKNLTVEGYCVSKIGATQGLVYDYIPVNYEACIPLKPNQKSWSTK